MADRPRKRRAVLSTYIYDSLRRAVMDGEYEVGSNVPSEMALCKEFKASRMTVRAALKRLAADGFVRSEPGRGWKVVSTDPPRRPADGRPVLLSGSGSPEGHECLEAARKTLQREGIDTRIRLTVPRRGREAGEIEWQRLGGAVFYSGVPLPEAVVVEAKRARAPVVCAMLAEQAPYDTVAPDHYHGTIECMERVIDRGARRIGYLSNQHLEDCPDPSFRERRRAYESVVSRLGTEPMVFLTKYNDAFSVAEGRRLADWVRQSESSGSPVEALFCTVTPLMELALLQLHINGVSAKDDVLVFGASYSLPRSLLELHGLERVLIVRHPAALVGQVAAERLAARVRGDATPPRFVLVKAEITEAEGTEESFDVYERHTYET